MVKARYISSCWYKIPTTTGEKVTLAIGSRKAKYGSLMSTRPRTDCDWAGVLPSMSGWRLPSSGETQNGFQTVPPP